jgi:hypothetical protein
MKKIDRGGSGGKGKDEKPGKTYPGNNPNKAFPIKGYGEVGLTGHEWNMPIWGVAKIRNKNDTGTHSVSTYDSGRGRPDWDKYVPPKTNMVGAPSKPKPSNKKAAKKK